MNLFQELKRRKVFKTVGVYAAASLIIIQVADIVFPRWDGFGQLNVLCGLTNLMNGNIEKAKTTIASNHS